jgi:hypothetical protein
VGIGCKIQDSACCRAALDYGVIAAFSIQTPRESSMSSRENSLIQVALARRIRGINGF